MKTLRIAAARVTGRANIALLTLGASTALAGQAHAQSSGVGGIADNIKGNFQDVGSMAIAGAFLAGVGLVMNGLWTLKKASDDQSRENYKSGVIRIGVGAGLAAVPTVLGVGLGTIFNGQTSQPNMQSATFSN